MSTYWLWKAPELEARRGNPQLVVRQVTIKRGLIYAADGKTVLARNRTRRGRRADLVPAPLPDARARRPARRLLDDRALAHRPRGVAERLPDRVERGPDDAPRPRARHAQGRRRGRGTTSSRRSTCDAQQVAMDAARRRMRLGRRARARDRPRARLRLHADVRPEPRRGELRPDHPDARGRASPPRRSLNRATRVRPLHPRLDVQGRHRHGRARHAARYTPESRFDDPGYCIEYGKRVSNYSDQGGAAGVRQRRLRRRRCENSINSVFCNIGKELGPAARPRLRRSASASTRTRRSRRPSDERSPSGL